MHIAHVTEYCHAGSTGGTERYILDIIHGLAVNGCHNTICWLQQGTLREPFECDGIRVFPLPTSPMRVDSPPSSLPSLAARFFENEKPDLLHFHTLGLTEVSLAALANKRGIPYVFTYHSPAWTCRRETLLLWGRTPCDGKVKAWRCSACQSEERLGAGRIGGYGAALASLLVGWAAIPLGRRSFRRRLAFFYDTASYHRAVRQFLSACELVVSCCDWSTPVLVANGARPEKVVLCPQGVAEDFLQAAASSLPAQKEAKSDLFTVGYVGRLSPVKGIHILMEGFSRLQARNARLRVNGWEPGSVANAYARQIHDLATRDTRIELVRRKPLSEILHEYARFDLLAIPSVWMETGPLTLMEASALHLPMFGSTRVGQLSLLRERGSVIEPNTPEAWHDALAKAVDEYRNGLWPKARQRARGNGRNRTMKHVAEEMQACYARILLSSSNS